MRINESTHIIGSKVVLVPYRKHHVPRYHRWMQSAELQELTASEPLSLQQEYDMQQSWHRDENKCTFILLDARLQECNPEDEIGAMIGDVNLFFNDEDNRHSAEVEIMIAEPGSRREGRGLEAMLAMMRYGVDMLQVQCFTAKVGFSNLASLNMMKKLSFTEVSRSDIFQEITFQLNITKQHADCLHEKTAHMKIVHHAT